MPQGAVLSTLLFNIMINDLWGAVKSAEFYTFADDIVLIIQGRKNLDLAIQELEDYSRKNDYVIN